MILKFVYAVCKYLSTCIDRDTMNFLIAIEPHRRYVSRKKLDSLYSLDTFVGIAVSVLCSCLYVKMIIHNFMILGHYIILKLHYVLMVLNISLCCAITL